MRCVNIDWLEVYCMESINNFPCNADFFRAQGLFVRERDYGTRQYTEMFTVLDERDMPFVEIRRNPVASGAGEKNDGIFSPYSCHIRLVNRYCYHDNAIGLLTDFLHRFDYTVQRLFRLDLCLDFERFDQGDDPHRFLQRFMAGRYSKINQGNLSGHAKDLWDGRDWNSCSWGSPQSMVTTKLYNKTLELREAKDKPYIRFAWYQAGLVDDPDTLTRHAEDGTVYNPDIWRVEFSIRSSAKGWVTIEDCNGNKQRRVVMEHNLATYATKLDQLHAFANLAHHYFHFKKFIKGQRKDRCPDKVLFEFNLDHAPYKLDVLAGDAPKPKTIDALAKRLTEYRMAHPTDEIRHACDVLLKQLAKEALTSSLPYDANSSERALLQLLISRRMAQATKEPLTESIKAVQALLSMPDTIF